MNKKTMVITGGARGLGRSGAERFLESREWRVAILDVNEQLLFSAADELAKKFGAGDVYPAVVDVTARQSVEKCFQGILQRFGRIDCLINNAGVTRDSMVHKMKEEDWDFVIAVNLKGVFNCAQAVIPHMKDRKSGSIINTSSVVGLYGNMGQSNYAATKFGVIGLTKTWARELGRDGIRVNAVAPGFTMTEMLQTVPEKVLAMMVDKTPLKRLGRPEDIANAYYFLASEQAAYITGNVLSVDGGIVL
ncbi:MAG: hypothetical protein A2583_09380 [Bdellovibrionales bacterium RIFOXYD1_FULL_53_11]|nr:MAG: hypothetical protein A2583_09380 [Bdellovibrionales bacterium RIFOXYD1_FULL_53_11]